MLCYLSIMSKYSLKPIVQGFPGGSVVKNPPASAGDMASIPGLERSHVLQDS